MTASSQNEFDSMKVECPERYPYYITGVAWRNQDDVTTGPKIGKST